MEYFFLHIGFMLRYMTVHSNLIKSTKCATVSPNVTHNCEASVTTLNAKKCDILHCEQ